MKLLVSLVLCLVVGFASVTDDVASLNVGLNGYILGKKLTTDQLSISKKNTIKKAVEGTYKFSDGELFIIASKTDDRVLVIYKDFNKIDNKKAKAILGNSILNFGEPTAIAHDKLVYWSYDKNGKKISEDELKIFKDKIRNKDVTLAETLKKEYREVKYEPYVTIKFSCSKEIMNRDVVYTDADAYLLYSSNKLIEDMQKKMTKK